MAVILLHTRETDTFWNIIEILRYRSLIGIKFDFGTNYYLTTYEKPAG